MARVRNNMFLQIFVTYLLCYFSYGSAILFRGHSQTATIGILEVAKRLPRGNQQLDKGVQGTPATTSCGMDYTRQLLHTSHSIGRHALIAATEKEFKFYV